ncbi:MAG TPA: hypothetical protein VGK01_10900, partial [Candidatus Angelobacter sp.]
DQAPPGAKDGLILGGVKLGEFFREYFVEMTSEEFFLVAATAAFDQRLVYSDITSLGILDEKCGIGNVIKKLLDDAEFGRNIRRDFRECMGKRKYVRLHSGSHIRAFGQRRQCDWLTESVGGS